MKDVDDVSETDSITSTKSLVAELQNALQDFDGIRVDSAIQKGFDVRHTYVDNQKYRNSLHELVLNYVSYPATLRPPKLHMKFIDVLTVLLNNGLDINEGDFKNQTALHYVASHPNHPDVLRVLIGSGARVNQPDSGKQSALHKAVVSGTVADVSVLLDAGADPNLTDNMGHTPLHVAVKKRNNRSIIKLLVKSKAKVDLNHPEWNKISRGSTALHMASRMGREENAYVLLRLSADPNIVDGTGQSPLHIAAAYEITGKLCRNLINHGSKVDSRDSLYGETALHKAIKANAVENVLVLLERGADPNMYDDQQETAMHKAASYCTNTTVWQKLLKCRGDTSKTNRNGLSSIDKASKAKNSNALAILRAAANG